jgi:hypothetical protein
LRRRSLTQPRCAARGRRLCAAAAGLVALALAGCASQVRLAEIARPAGLPARVELASTPFHPQSDQQCGPAALATLLGARGRAESPEQLSREIFVPGRQGSLQPELVGAIRARGLVPYPLGPQLEELLAELAAGRPVLVLQKQGLGPWPAWHYAVVIGYDLDRGTLLLRSGTTERLALRADLFEATWGRAEHWGLVALAPGEMPARPDLARYLQAAASLESVGQSGPAQAAYAAAAERWPQEPLPRLGLANLAAAQGRWADAERGYAAVLERDPGSAAAINNRAEALSQLGCHAEARLVLERGAGQLAPQDPLRATLERTLRQAELRAAATTAAEPAACLQLDAR